MPEQLQQIIDRIVEWWKKFNKKQNYCSADKMSGNKNKNYSLY